MGRRGAKCEVCEVRCLGKPVRPAHAMPFKDPARRRAAVAASMRKKRAAMTPAEKEAEGVKHNARRRKKYREDKEWREKVLAANHEHYLRSRGTFVPWPRTRAERAPLDKVVKALTRWLAQVPQGRCGGGGPSVQGCPPNHASPSPSPPRPPPPIPRSCSRARARRRCTVSTSASAGMSTT